MFGALAILLILPKFDISRVRGSQFRPLNNILTMSLFANFLILMWIGACHPETPYLEIGQIATAYYFCWFLFLVPLAGLVENTLMDLALEPIKEKQS